MPENTHRTGVRVYYEDTDFSGRVYHASYVRFFERGRTEWLRRLGFHHNALAQTNDTAFAVTKMQVEFVAAAFIDDLLEVVTTLENLSGPVMNFRQAVTKHGVMIATGSFDIVAIRNNRPIRPPREILEAVANLKRR